ncbi:putative potassium transporter 17 [Frankliniella fusca]|uniref:Potassium transporter 17 n=1 Tax=Frankliniella fusca TaxID=407009 RepID=A0AAE1HS51_9NEOP|nr:putative potassium transporter 17 [Frankliniella fusca]
MDKEENLKSAPMGLESEPGRKVDMEAARLAQLSSARGPIPSLASGPSESRFHEDIDRWKYLYAIINSLNVICSGALAAPVLVGEFHTLVLSPCLLAGETIWIKGEAPER